MPVVAFDTRIKRTPACGNNLGEEGPYEELLVIRRHSALCSIKLHLERR